MSWPNEQNNYVFKHIHRGQIVSPDRINRIDKLAPELLRDGGMGDIEKLLEMQTKNE